jgi:hypothetical protein
MLSGSASGHVGSGATRGPIGPDGAIATTHWHSGCWATQALGVLGNPAFGGHWMAHALVWVLGGSALGHVGCWTLGHHKPQALSVAPSRRGRRAAQCPMVPGLHGSFGAPDVPRSKCSKRPTSHVWSCTRANRRSSPCDGFTRRP